MDEELVKKWTELIKEYQRSLKWAREKLKEREDECRRLKLLILRMTENREEKEAADDFDP